MKVLQDVSRDNYHLNIHNYALHVRQMYYVHELKQPISIKDNVSSRDEQINGLNPSFDGRQSD